MAASGRIGGERERQGGLDLEHGEQLREFGGRSDAVARLRVHGRQAYDGGRVVCYEFEMLTPAEYETLALAAHNAA